MGGKRGSLPGEIRLGSTEKMRSEGFRIKEKDLSKTRRKRKKKT